MSEKQHAILESMRAHQRFELGAPRSVADDVELHVGKIGGEQAGGGDQRLVALLGAQIGDGDDRADRPRGGVRATLRVAGGVDAVRNHRNRSGREPLRLENAPCRLRIRDHLRGTPIGQALQPDLARRLVGVELAAAADPYRHARQGGSRQAEDVRVKVACLHHRDPLAPAPAREGEQRANRCRPAEALDRKFDNRGRALRHPWQPRATLVEAGDVDAKPRGIQAPDQFGHLPLRSSRLEPGQEDGDRNLRRRVHSRQSQQGRCHAEPS